MSEIERYNLPKNIQNVLDVIEEKNEIYLVSYFMKYDYYFKNMKIDEEIYENDNAYFIFWDFYNVNLKRDIAITYSYFNHSIKNSFGIMIFDKDDSKRFKQNNMEIDRFLCDKENKSRKELFYLESYKGDTIGEKLENMFKKWVELFEKHLKGVLQGGVLVDGYQIDVGY